MVVESRSIAAILPIRPHHFGKIANQECEFRYTFTVLSANITMNQLGPSRHAAAGSLSGEK